jgi:hypothetical protein
MLFGETVAVYCESHTEHTDTVCTSQKTQYVSATESKWLMLIGETVAVFLKLTLNYDCENRMEHTQSVPHRKHIWADYRDFFNVEVLHVLHGQYFAFEKRQHSRIELKCNRFDGVWTVSATKYHKIYQCDDC